MKICDIYPYLHAYLEMLDYVRLKEDQLSAEIFDYLKRINVEPPKDREVRSSSKAKFRSMYESSKRNEDLGQKVSRNSFNQKRASNEQLEGSTAVLNGAAVLKNDSNRSAFNFLTNGFSDT